MTHENHDMVICGAGPVGLALALMLSKRGIAHERIILFDGKTQAQSEQDVRVIALSYGSAQLLKQVGCWPIQATPIHDIHVSRRAHFGRTQIKASDYDLPALGYVARYGAIVTPLIRAAQAAGIRIERPCLIEGMDEDETGIELKLQDGRTHRAAIVVQAEGGTFDSQQTRNLRRDYAQTAIIAEVQCDAPKTNRAFERFTGQGPLALLPLERGYALVWCTQSATAQTLMTHDDATFLAALQTAFGQRLGHLTALSPRHAFPLGLNAHDAHGKRSVSIGNAAQTLHPVAGQGLNLGLRDAAVLARLLAQQITPATLQDFTAQRNADRKSTLHLTDTLARIFASSADGSLRQSLLGMGLCALDLLPAMRAPLAKHMLFGWRN